MYQLISYNRQNDQLVIELKEYFGEATMLVGALVGFVLFLVLLFVPPLFLLAIGMLAFRLYYYSKMRLFLYYNAGTLRVVRNCDFGFWQWRKQTIYNRADVPQPVSWVKVLRTERGTVSRDHVPKVWQYQVRFPYAQEKNLGVICVCKTGQMRQLQQVVDAFFAETPYDETLFAPAEAAVTPKQVTWKTQIAPKKKQIEHESREGRRFAKRFSETKRYTFDRGDAPINRGDESFDKSEQKFGRTKSRAPRQKSYKLRHRSIIQAEDWANPEFNHGTLKLVATTGGPISAVMATLSILLYRVLMTGLILWPLAMIAHYSQGPQINEHVVPRLEQFITTQIAEQYQEPLRDVLREYAEINADQGKFSDMAWAVFLIWGFLILFFVVLSRVIRWPFWGRWTVLLRHTGTYPYEILFSWRNDRSKYNWPPNSFAAFFRVVPATPKTNRLLTGRSFRVFDPGWKQPHQIVFITDECSFALPCGSIDEQEQTIKRVRRFADAVKAPNEFGG